MGQVADYFKTEGKHRKPTAEEKAAMKLAMEQAAKAFLDSIVAPYTNVEGGTGAAMYQNGQRGYMVNGKFVRSGDGSSLGAKSDDTYRDAYGAAISMQDTIDSTGLQAQKSLAEMGSRESRYAAFNDKQTESKLSKVFGPVGDFDIYKEAFKSLEGAVSGAMGAWIDGSMSAGQAFKRFIGEALKALASQMLVESLKHAAYALGSLAFGDLAGAARHGAAAAEFAAGAVIAGVAAKEMGGAGGSTSASGGGGGKGASGGASAPSFLTPGIGTQTQGDKIIVYADSYADDSPRMKVLKAQKLLALAGVGNGVTGG